VRTNCNLMLVYELTLNVIILLPFCKNTQFDRPDADTNPYELGMVMLSYVQLDVVPFILSV
jgi:hypothetical protein